MLARAHTHTHTHTHTYTTASASVRVICKTTVCLWTITRIRVYAAVDALWRQTSIFVTAKTKTLWIWLDRGFGSVKTAKK